MVSVSLAVGVASAVCLAFPSTRVLGVLGATLLGLFHPVPVLVLLLLAGVLLCSFHYWRS